MSPDNIKPKRTARAATRFQPLMGMTTAGACNSATCSGTADCLPYLSIDVSIVPFYLAQQNH
jgi:hypothetical protein